MSLEGMLAAMLFGALAAYVIIAGSELGAGVWYLFASGPRAVRHRRVALNATTITGLHDAWLLLVAVILCVAFPIAFGRMLGTFSWPLLVTALVIVGRVALLAWCLWATGHGHRRPWVEGGLALMGVLPPFLLAGCLAVLGMPSDGTQRHHGLSPYVLTVASLGVALFAMLGALTLYGSVTDRALERDFRRRTFGAVVVANILAVTALALSRQEAPLIWDGLTGHVGGWLILGAEAALVVMTLLCVLRHHAPSAHAMGIASVVTLLAGWAYAQYPFMILPDLTVYNAAAPAWSLRYLMLAFLLGGLMLPALYYLYRLFKGAMTFRKA